MSNEAWRKGILPKQEPHPTRTGLTTTNTILQDNEKHVNWMGRWERDFRQKFWVEFKGSFWPRPGFEPQGFSFGNRMARDNALEHEKKRVVGHSPVPTNERQKT